MSTNRQRYTVSVTQEMFDQIEDFRFKNRYQTRSEATVELIRLGLEQLKKEKDLDAAVEEVSAAARRELTLEQEAGERSFPSRTGGIA